MSKRYWKNIFYCLIIPTIIAGLVCNGFFFVSYSIIGESYPISVFIFLSGCQGFLVGLLIKSVFKWEDASSVGDEE